MVATDLLVFYIDDFHRNEYWDSYILGKPDYKNYGGYDKKTVYYPSVLKGRHDYIVNYALNAGLLEGYKFFLVVDGESDLSNAAIEELLNDMEESQSDMLVPLSNYGRKVQTGEINKIFSMYAYLSLDCFLIKVETLKKMNGFEAKFCHVTFPEMYLDTFYTTLPNYDMSFCLKMWQNDYKVVLDENLKVTFAAKQERNYSPLQQSGGDDAIWYYHHLLANDVEQCEEGFENVNKLIREKLVNEFPEPEIDMVYKLDSDKKLILIVLPLFMHQIKTGTPLENCLPVTTIYQLFFEELCKKGYVVKFIQRDLLEQASAILFLWYSGDIFFTSHRVYESAYIEKWEKIICDTGNQYKTILCASSEPYFVAPNHYKKETHYNFAFCLTGNQELIDNKKYFYQPAIIDFLFNFENNYDFENKKLCAFVGGGFFRELRDKRCLYPERLAIVSYFDRYHSNEFELYGARWAGKNFETYQGFASDRFEVFAKFKFLICIPNYIHKSTEFFDGRIFYAMVSGCVPIYLGCPDIKDVVPEDTFIDLRDFPTYDDLYKFISEMDKDTYNGYLVRIKRFLESSDAQKYSVENYTDCVIKMIARIEAKEAKHKPQNR